MANKRIKGITIAMEADTTGVTKGLKEITSQSVAASKNLKNISDLLKLDPQNTELLAEKQKLLSQAIETTKQKLTALRGAQEDVNKAYANGDINTEQYLAFQKELVQTEKRLNSLEGELTDEQRAIDSTGGEAVETAGDMAKLGKETAEAGEKAASSGEGFTILKGIVANLAAEAIMAATNALKDLGEALVNVGKQAVASYGSYEQLSGGVSKIFGESADTVRQYAEQAFSSAGLSANEYMETVTSFSSSLLQGLGGDTEEAARIANTAVTDMADNANTFGTNISDIQNAYQGFAKQNYSLLDNLKLGYGGTQSEMIRLINDSGVLNETISSLDGISFDTIINAIHEIQVQTGIAETTANEAAGTVEGSINTTKAAWQNFLTALAAGDEIKLSSSFDSLVESAENVLENIQPLIRNIIKSLGEIAPEATKALMKHLPELLKDGAELLRQILKGIVDSLPEIVPAMVDFIGYIGETLIDIAPQLIEAALQIVLELAQGLTDSLPELLPAIAQTISDICLMLTEPEMLEQLIQAALQLIVALGQGLIQAIPILLENLPQIIENIITALLESLPLIADAGVQLLSSLVTNMPQITANVLSGITELVGFLAQKFTETWDIIQQVFSPMVEFFGTLWEGVKGVFFVVVDWFKERFTTAWDAIKTAWSNVTLWFKNIWTSIKNTFFEVASWFGKIFTTAWSGVKTAWSGAVSWFRDIWNGISNAFSGAAEWFRGVFDSAWANIRNAWNGVGDFFSGIWNTIANTFSDLGNRAWSWGVDLVENFLQGIRDMWGRLTGTLSNLAQTVVDYIGFSEPDKGPLSDFHTFAPDMIELFTQGIKENAWKIEQAMATSLGTAMNGLESVANVEVRQAANAPAQTVIDNSRTVYQTNNSPRSLSRLEIYRMTKNAVTI